MFQPVDVLNERVENTIERSASAVPRCIMSSGAKKRKDLAVLAETPRLNRFYQQKFQAATLKQWRKPEHLKM